VARNLRMIQASEILMAHLQSQIREAQLTIEAMGKQERCCCSCHEDDNDYKATMPRTRQSIHSKGLGY
jgi:hypothetical protein